jgi:hypothetical protein
MTKYSDLHKAYVDAKAQHEKYFTDIDEFKEIFSSAFEKYLDCPGKLRVTVRALRHEMKSELTINLALEPEKTTVTIRFDVVKKRGNYLMTAKDSQQSLEVDPQALQSSMDEIYDLLLREAIRLAEERALTPREISPNETEGNRT